MEDDLLMQKAAAGDVEAFGRLVRRYQRRLVRFVERMTGDAETAEDAAQEAFLRLWRTRETYRPQGSLSSYLLRIVRNLCLDHARTGAAAARRERAVTGASWIEGPAAHIEAKSLAEAVRKAVHELPEPQRAVFVLSEYEGLPYREIAEALGCPVGTVASRKRLALETLRRRLAPWREERCPK
ncbi:MAG TPA: RNA polymerase sigma factor [Chthonomonadaceae bacterium]|nr:RNA polymerase sigma factor [Chthonomonadaceae bacterium]